MTKSYICVDELQAAELFTGKPFPESDLVVFHPNPLSLLELEPEFIQQLQTELSQRMLLVKSGLDTSTAVDKLLALYISNGSLRFLKEEQK
jgi:hypothetical protein